MFKSIPLLCTHVYLYMFSTMHSPSRKLRRIITYLEHSNLVKTLGNVWTMIWSCEFILGCKHDEVDEPNPCYTGSSESDSKLYTNFDFLGGIKRKRKASYTFKLYIDLRSQ